MNKAIIFCKSINKIPSIANFEFRYFCKDKRKDKDNIAAGAKKIIFDALVKSDKMENDGWSQVGDWSETFEVDKERPRIEVSIYC